MIRIATLAATTAAVLMMAAGPQAFGQQSSTQTAPPPSQALPPPSGTQVAPPDKQNDQQMAGREEDFLKEVAQASQIEVDASTLAATKAQNAEVKAFADKLVRDHTAACEELDDLVKSKHADWAPDDPKYKEKKQKHESLQTLSGAAFDKEYLEDMISDHEAVLALFGKYTLNAKDADIKSFAEKTQPALRDHLKMARDLKAKLFK